MSFDDLFYFHFKKNRADVTTVLAGPQKRRELLSDFFFSIYRKVSYTIENNIIFNLLLNLIHTNTHTIIFFYTSLVLIYHSFSPHYNFFTFYSHARIPARHTQQ